jgi:chitodextrinase
MQSATFSLKAPHHEVSWDFSALKSGRHVLSIECSIFSDERSATAFYLASDGGWVELPRLSFRSPWHENKLRYYLVDLPQGANRFKVKFSGNYSNMFYISGAKLFEISNLLPDLEVSQNYAGPGVDQVFFGTDTLEDFTRHNGSLNGEMQTDSFSLKTSDHKISWDFEALGKGLHVLAIECGILSEDRRATPYYMDQDGFWLELPEMRFMSPGNENKSRYFLIDIPGGVNRYKVEFSGKYSKMFYLRSARLYRMADAIDDHDPPVIIDYISAATDATFCDIRWFSNEPSSVEILYGRQIDQFEHSVSSDRFSEDPVMTLSNLDPMTRYYYQIDLTDAAGNRSNYGPYDFITDELPFQISNVHFNGLTDSSATILWETDIASAGSLHYGPPPSLVHSAQDSAFATDHYILLDGLLPDTVYYFKIEAYDETGNIAYADNYGDYYRFRTSALNRTPLAVEIDGDGIDNDGDGFSDRADPDGYLAVDSNIGTPDSASDIIGSLEDKVDFGFRHWSVGSGDPIDDERDIDDSMGAHSATNTGGRILEVSIFGGTTEWDFKVSQPGYYILSLFGWWRDTRVYYFDSNQWNQLPQPSGHFAQYYLVRLSQPAARFKLENGYHIHAQIFQIGSDPFSGAAPTPVHPRLYFKPGDIQHLKDRIEDVAVLGNPTDSYRHFLLNGWGSASFYLAAAFTATTRTRAVFS